MGYKIYGGKIHVYGDLHLSCVYVGKHKDYIEECFLNMENILSRAREEQPNAIFFLGDIIGVNERNIKDRRFLTRICLFFKQLNSITHGNVFSVMGNHDKGDFSDFDFLVGIGLLKKPDYVDYYNCSKEKIESGEVSEADALEVRFHFVNYGEEDRKLQIIPSEEGVSNVVLGHSDYIISGLTNWYQHKGGVNLGTLSNFRGVELVISGHIHNPSEEILTTVLSGQEEIGLFYVGSPARTAERFDDCWYVVFSIEDGGVEYEAKFFGLKPAKEVFISEEEDLSEISEEDLERQKEQESLTNIVKEIIDSRITSGDLFQQIMVVPHASDKVKGIACDYLHKAFDMK